MGLRRVCLLHRGTGTYHITKDVAHGADKTRKRKHRHLGLGWHELYGGVGQGRLRVEFPFSTKWRFEKLLTALEQGELSQ